MKAINGHFDGERVILDEPVPAEITPPAPVKVIFDSVGSDGGNDGLEDILRLARPGGLPADYAEQHDHYVKGTPCK